jgi:DNA excision repair protein ERCC-3
VGEYSGQRKDIKPITIATYQVLTWSDPSTDPDADLFVRHPHLALFDREEWGLVIYDEVHLLPAPVFRATARIQAVRRLGLTATLVREDGKQGDVFSLIGPKRYDAPWKELEAQGWIAPAACTEVRVEMTPEERMAYATVEANLRYRVAATAPAKMDVMAHLVERHADDQLLVIGQYLDQLKEASQLLDAPLITGQTGHATRDELFERFREGDLRRLVVSKVANFSIDLPNANVAIQLSGTFGSRQEEAQRLGRILRPLDEGKVAYFYTIVTRETVDQSFASKRQRFLAEQGYSYFIVDADELDDLSGLHMG